MLLTFITDTANITDEPILYGMEVQLELKTNGEIRFSYKRTDHFTAASYIIGLFAGIGKPMVFQDMNNEQSGFTSGAVPTGMVMELDAIEFDEEEVQKVIYELNPEKYYDDVFITTDFTHIVRSPFAGLGGSLGQVVYIFANYDQGTGLSLSPLCDECIDKHVEAIVFTNSFLSVDPDYNDTTNYFHHRLLHEFGHKWMAFVNAESVQNLCVSKGVTNGRCHWAEALSATHDRISNRRSV